MGKPVYPMPVKLFTGVLFGSEEDYNSAMTKMESFFGSVDCISDVFSFSLTNYYAPEMGDHLKRCFWSFSRLIDPARLPEIKRITNVIEDELSNKGKRTVNLDPGYIDLHKMILASVKERAHKVYLSGGIYADATLFYLKGVFHPYEWALPDFKENTYYDYFFRIRQQYRENLKTYHPLEIHFAGYENEKPEN